MKKRALGKSSVWILFSVLPVRSDIKIMNLLVEDIVSV